MEFDQGVEYDERERGKNMRAAAILVLVVMVVGCGRSLSEIRDEIHRESQAKNYGRAAELCTEAMRIDPHGRGLHLASRTDAYLMGGELEKAEADCEERLAADQWDAWAYMDRGRLRKRQKRYAEAIMDYATAKRLNPEYEQRIQPELEELVALVGMLKPEQVRKDTLRAVDAIPIIDREKALGKN